MPLRKPLNWINAALSRRAAADSVITHFYDGDRNRLRLRTLVMLRWLAIAGQSAMLVVVAFGFGFHFNLWLTLSVILASVWLNIVLLVGRRNVQRMSGWEAAAQLS